MPTALDVQDQNRLQFMAVMFLEQDPSTWNTSDLRLTLHHAGITRFNQDFLRLSVQNIEELVVPRPGRRPDEKLPRITYPRLTIVLSFYHFTCRKYGSGVNIMSISKGQCDRYRTQMCDANKHVVPWRSTHPTDDAVSVWRKHTKPSKSDYKIFKDASLWPNSQD